MHIYRLSTTNGPQHIGQITAPILDRIADAELQHGHTARAEQLAALAASLRDSVP